MHHLYCPYYGSIEVQLTLCQEMVVKLAEKTTLRVQSAIKAQEWTNKIALMCVDG